MKLFEKKNWRIFRQYANHSVLFYSPPGSQMFLTLINRIEVAGLSTSYGSEEQNGSKWKMLLWNDSFLSGSSDVCTKIFISDPSETGLQCVLVEGLPPLEWALREERCVSLMRKRTIMNYRWLLKAIRIRKNKVKLQNSLLQ